MSELRRDPITGRWVIVLEADVRDYALVRDYDPEQKDDYCPFCPGHESDTPHNILVYKSNDPGSKAPWNLRVIPNRIPMLRVEEALKKEGEGIFDKISGVGAHEVIIETPDHNLQFGDFSKTKMEEVFSCFKDRMLDLRNDSRLKYAMVFKNHGGVSGARISHSHSQLIALPFIPYAIEEEQRGARNHYRQKERCIYCDIIKEEIRLGMRVVLDEAGFIAFIPYAATSAFETWILPKNHLSQFEEISKEDIGHLANVIGLTFQRLNKALSNPPYQFIIHTNPLHGREHPYYHWHIEITPVLRVPFAFERACFTYVNAVAPEQAASYLRTYC